MTELKEDNMAHTFIFYSYGERASLTYSFKYVSSRKTP